MYLNLFIFILIYSFSQIRADDQWYKEIHLDKLLDILFQFGGTNNELREKCVKGQDFLNYFFYEFEYSGKRYGEVGDRDSCVRNNVTYIFFVHNISGSIAKIKEKHESLETIDVDVHNKNIMKLFFNITKYVIGFCIYYKCIEVFENFLRLNSDKLGEFFDSHLGEIKIFYDNDFKQLYPKFSYYNASIIYPPKKKLFEIEFQAIKYNIIIFLCISLLCTVIKVFFFFANNNETIIKPKKSNFNDSEEEDEEIEEEDEIINKNQISIFGDELGKEKINFYSSNEKQNIYKFLYIFDIFNNIRNFFLYKNNYFDGSCIEIIGFIRMITIIGIIFGNNFIIGITSFIQIDIFNFIMFKSLKFIFVKLTFFNNIIWIILDGVIFGFKLLSYLKNYRRNDKLPKKINIYCFLKFLILLIPNVLTFLFTYFIFYIFATNIQDDIYFDYYMTTLNDYKCYREPFMIFNPFNFYKNDFNCFSFVYIFINEFYCILIILIITYVSTKINRKSFDIIISCIILMQLFTVQITVSSKIDNSLPITFDMLKGENHMENQLHLFLSIFYLGFLIGISFFYYHNPLTSISLSSHKEYYPYVLMKNIVEFINNIEIKYNLMICSICSILLLFIAFIPQFFKDCFGLLKENKCIKDKDGNTKDIDVNTMLDRIKYIIFYEKSVYALFFSILLLDLKILSEKTFISSAFQNGFIISFEKLRVIFFCSIEFLLNYCYTIFIFNYLFTYKNLVYITFGLFLIIYIINFLIYVLFIMPLIKFGKAIKQFNIKKNLKRLNLSQETIKTELTDYNIFNNIN